MAITYINEQDSVTSSTVSHIENFTFWSVTAGNLLICAGRVTDTTTSVTLSDNDTNTWRHYPGSPYVPIVGQTMQFWCAYAVCQHTRTDLTVMATFSAASTNPAIAMAQYHSDIGWPAPPFNDGAFSLVYNSSSGALSNSITTANARDLIFAHIRTQAAPPTGLNLGWTDRFDWDFTYASWLDRLPTTAGTYTLTGTSSGSSIVSVLFGFKETVSTFSFPMAIHDTSSVLALNFEGTFKFFPLAIHDTSTVTTLGFHVSTGGGFTGTTWVSNGADVGGSGSYVPSTQSVQFIHDNFAAAGDRITIPTGTFTWLTGVQITKAITITGTQVLNSTKINYKIAGTGSAFGLTPVTAGVLELGWIDFICDASITAKTGYFIVVGYVASGQPFLIHDCQAASKNQLLSQFLIQHNGGIIYKCAFDGGSHGTTLDSIDEALQFKYDAVDTWKTNSTMGMTGDPNGTLNTYVEDCTFVGYYTEATDFDGGARTVFRHCTFTNAVMASHGYDTGPVGCRHWEIYDNTFRYTYSSGDPNAAPVQAFLTLRGGTGVVTGNSFTPNHTTQWGSKATLNWLTDGVTQGAAGHCYTIYPAARQIGQGWSTGTSGTYPEAPELGSGYFTDPAYVFSNTIDTTYETGAFIQSWIDNTGCPGGHTSAEFIQSGRDFFLDAGARPGWSRYTYPHPLRADAGPAAIHFPVQISDTSTVLKLGATVTRRLPVIVADTSTVTTLGFHITKVFPTAIADTSTVSRLIFAIGGHFPVTVHDTSTVLTLNFEAIRSLSIHCADISTVTTLAFETALRVFPIHCSDTSTVFLDFQGATAPPVPVPPVQNLPDVFRIPAPFFDDYPFYDTPYAPLVNVYNPPMEDGPSYSSGGGQQSGTVNSDPVQPIGQSTPTKTKD